MSNTEAIVNYYCRIIKRGTYSINDVLPQYKEAVLKKFKEAEEELPPVKEA